MKIVRLFDIHWDNEVTGFPNECIVIADDNWKPQDAAIPLIEEFDCQAVMCSCEVLGKGQFSKTRDVGDENPV